MVALLKHHQGLSFIQDAARSAKSNGYVKTSGGRGILIREQCRVRLTVLSTAPSPRPTTEQKRTARNAVGTKAASGLLYTEGRCFGLSLCSEGRDDIKTVLGFKAWRRILFCRDGCTHRDDSDERLVASAECECTKVCGVAKRPVTRKLS